MKKLKITRKDAERAAAELGWTIDEDHFSENEKKRGRPKNTRKIVSLSDDPHGDDIIARLLAKVEAEAETKGECKVEVETKGLPKDCEGASEDKASDNKDKDEALDNKDECGVEKNNGDDGGNSVTETTPEVEEKYIKGDVGEDESEDELDVGVGEDEAEDKLDEAEDEAEDELEVEEITIEDVDYLIDGDGNLYDIESEEEIGEYDRETKRIEIYKE
jgi:hypothetical protein